jgi:hypothetical protein
MPRSRIISLAAFQRRSNSVLDIQAVSLSLGSSMFPPDLLLALFGLHDEGRPGISKPKG